MQFTTDNCEDIKKYYHGCFVKIKEKGDTLFQITTVTKNEVRGEVEDGGQFVIYLNNEDPFEMDYVLPNKSYFQKGKDAYQLYRMPAQQYQRGLNENNTKVSKVGNDGVKEEGAHISFDILKSFVTKQQFFTLSQASGKNGNAYRSCVLTPRMMFHRASRGIYMDFQRVAEVHGQEIKLLHTIFRPEIEEFLAHTGDNNLFKIV